MTRQNSFGEPVIMAVVILELIRTGKIKMPTKPPMER
jgi:hypothetical protein